MCDQAAFGAGGNEVIQDRRAHESHQLQVHASESKSFLPQISTLIVSEMIAFVLVLPAIDRGSTRRSAGSKPKSSVDRRSNNSTSRAFGTSIFKWTWASEDFGPVLTSWTL